MSEAPRIPLSMLKRIDFALEDLRTLKGGVATLYEQNRIRNHARQVLNDLRAFGGDAHPFADRIQAALEQGVGS